MSGWFAKLSNTRHPVHERRHDARLQASRKALGDVHQFAARSFISWNRRGARRSPVAVAGHSFKGYAGHESRWRVVHRREPHVWSYVVSCKPLEKLRSAAFGNAGGPVDHDSASPCGPGRPVSSEITTRGSRLRFLTFFQEPRWPAITSLSSSPTHTTVACGLPSGFRVTRWARYGPSRTSRTGSESGVMS